jgi:anti-sigma factor RsiW
MNNSLADDRVCQELVEIITGYLEGTISEPDRARFDAHVLSCPGCREYVEQMQITLRLTGRLAVESISPSARDELLRAYRRMKDSTGL